MKIKLKAKATTTPSSTKETVIESSVSAPIVESAAVVLPLDNEELDAANEKIDKLNAQNLELE